MNEFMSREDLAKLNERDRRLMLAKYAMSLGYGGISKISKQYNVSRNTIRHGIRDLQSNEDLSTRIRRPGAGRRSLEKTYPTLIDDVLALAKEGSYQKEGSDTRVLTTSCRRISREVSEKYNHSFSPTSINRILQEHGYECPRRKK